MWRALMGIFILSRVRGTENHIAVNISFEPEAILN